MLSLRWWTPRLPPRPRSLTSSAAWRAEPMPPQSEAGLLVNVLALAKLLGWRAVHFRPARLHRGWNTPFQGDGAYWAFIDLTVTTWVAVRARTATQNGPVSEIQVVFPAAPTSPPNQWAEPPPPNYPIQP